MAKTVYTDKNNEIIDMMISLEKDSSEYIELRNQLVQNNLDYIESFIKTKCSDVLNYCNYEDLYHSCLVMLFEVVDSFIEKYKKNKNCNFRAYISMYLTRHLKDILEDNLPIHVKEIDDCDIDDSLCDSLDELYDDDEEGYLYDKSSDDLIVFGSIKKDYDLYKIIEDSEFRRIIYNELMHDFTEKQRKAFFNYFSDPNRTFEETAKFCDLSRPNVNCILKRCIYKLRRPFRMKKFFDWDCSRDRWIYKKYKKEYKEEFDKAIEKKWDWESWEVKEKMKREKEESVMAKAKKAAEKAAEEKVEEKVAQEAAPNTTTDEQEFIEYLKDKEKSGRPKKESVAEARSSHMGKTKKSDMEKMADAIGVANPALALAMQAQMHLDTNQICKLTTMIKDEDVFVTQTEYINFYVKPMMDYLNNIVLRDYPHLEVKFIDHKSNVDYNFKDETVKAAKQTKESEKDFECPHSKGFISFKYLEDIFNLINKSKENVYTPSTDFYDKVIEDILLAVNTGKFGMARIHCSMDEYIELKAEIKKILEKANSAKNNIIKCALLNDIVNIINEYSDITKLGTPEQIDMYIDDVLKQGNKRVKGEVECE